jgi:hypothetical protein
MRKLNGLSRGERLLCINLHNGETIVNDNIHAVMPNATTNASASKRHQFHFGMARSSVVRRTPLEKTLHHPKTEKE